MQVVSVCWSSDPLYDHLGGLVLVGEVDLEPLKNGFDDGQTASE
jgi:hypothetical protein